MKFAFVTTNNRVIPWGLVKTFSVDKLVFLGRSCKNFKKSSHFFEEKAKGHRFAIGPKEWNLHQSLFSAISNVISLEKLDLLTIDDCAEDGVEEFFTKIPCGIERN